MKNIFLMLAGCFFTFSAMGQIVPDTIFIYETVTVYDTLKVYDTIRVYTPKAKALQPKYISGIFYDSPATFLPVGINLVNHNHIGHGHHIKKVKEMNFKKINWLSGLLLSLGIATGQAQEPEEAALDLFPAQVTFIYPMSTHGNNSTNYRYNLSFNMLMGKVGGINGLEFGGLTNRVLTTVSGIQVAGLGNFAGQVTGLQFAGLGNRTGDVSGIQVGGLANLAKNTRGIQFAGLGNESGDSRGLQVSGLINSSGDITGIQFGGLLNFSSETRGLQVAGIQNRAKSANGLQFAGILNRSGEATGAQISGVVNRTGVLRGFQFGIVSINDTIESGISMSIINIVKKGFYKEFALYFSDYNNIEFNYKMGTQKFYSIYSAGANFIDEHLWVFGFGFGSRKAISRRIDFQPELVAHQYFPEDFRNIRSTSSVRLKVGFVYKINERLGLSVAPSIYNLNSHKDTNEVSDKVGYDISFISPVYSYKTNDHITSVGFGISVGLILR